VYSQNPVAQGLHPHEVALLNAIAARESAGRYDVRFSPRGPQRFQGFDQHPGIYEQGPAGPSSAAGRYQFVKKTWDGLPAEVRGDGTFSPENQDRAALWLARRDYRARTGQDLDQVLQTDGFTQSVAQTLKPTWAGLGGGFQKIDTAYRDGVNNPTAGLLAAAPAQQTPAMPAPQAPDKMKQLGAYGMGLLAEAQKKQQAPAWQQAAWQQGLLG
jgi:muramidase (phage lysozyme)